MNKTLITLILIGVYSFPFLGRSQTNNDKWGQYLKYDIDVKLDPQSHELRGSITIDYQNNSPDTLGYIIVHLYPNAYSADSTAYNKQLIRNHHTRFYFSDEDEKGWIDSLFFTVNGKECFYSNYQGNPDVIYLDIRQKILPGESATIRTPFRVVIPPIFSRMGHYENFFTLSQWYPKPAVYDEDGWHPLPYLDLGEFYSEFADYDVKITVPQNFVVAASGNLQDSSEYAFLNSRKDYSADSDSSGISTETKTLNYIQNRSHDFAWTASKNFKVQHDTCLLGSEIIDIYSYYRPQSESVFNNAIEYSKRSLRFCSENIGPYPYDQLQIVEGNTFDASIGGMEYTSYALYYVEDPSTLETSIYHEVAHNWFYGILANNERYEAFMDESFTTLMHSIIEKKFDTLEETLSKKNPTLEIDGKLLNNIFAYRGKYHNLLQNSDNFKELMYGTFYYNFGYKIVDYLRNYLGEEEFWDLMKGYYSKYKFTHVKFSDFTDYIESNASKDVSWFRNLVIHSEYPMDFKVKQFKSNRNGLSFKVKNYFPYALPVSVSVENGDSVNTYWTAPFKGVKTEMVDPQNGKSQVIINKDKVIPETKLDNNSGRKRYGLALGLDYKIGFKKKLGVIPALGYNWYDGMMTGLAVHNFNTSMRNVNFWINAMYAFRSKNIVGSSAIQKTWYTYNSNLLKSIDFGLNFKSFTQAESGKTFDGELLFNQYRRLSSKLDLYFDNHTVYDDVTKKLQFGAYFIQKEDWVYNYKLSDSSIYLTHEWNDLDPFGTVSYNYENKRLFNPYKYNVTAHVHSSFVKLMSSFQAKISYSHKKKQGVTVRAFGGYMFDNPDTDRKYYLYTTNGSETDYLYEHTMLGRGKQAGIPSNQFFIREGGFKTTSPYLANPIGIADKWLIALNTSVDIPIRKIPLSVYLDLSRTNRAKDYNTDGNTLLYNSGLAFENQYLSLYFPLFYSKDYKNYFLYNTDNKWYNRLSFQINLPLEQIWHLDRFL